MVLPRRVVREEEFFIRKARLFDESFISKNRGVFYYYTKDFENKVCKVKFTDNEISEIYKSIKKCKNYIYSLYDFDLERYVCDFYFYKKCKEFSGLPQKNFDYIFKYENEHEELESISLLYNRKKYREHLYQILDIDMFENFLYILPYNPLYFIFKIDEDTGKANSFIVGRLLDKKIFI